ncbi:MAG TPA: rRNA maturation RNase YbeY [Acidimicrobiia bacterium]|nr:rRNA maturation RNase YbeY [Acidimicrobiia bacterium]
MKIDIADEHPSSGIDIDQVRSWAEAALKEEGVPFSTEVSVTLVSDQQMAGWNEQALGKTGPTDVLSFPVESLRPGDLGHWSEQGPPLLLGDVVIAPDYVRRQARELEADLDDELALMITHGLLHLLGYDHVSDDDAQVMEDREREILLSLGRRRR